MREIVDGITDEQMNSIIRVGNSYCCEYVWLSKEMDENRLYVLA